MSPENTQLQKHNSQELAQPTPADMMKLIVDKGINAENVQAFEKLAELQWRFEERDAEREFDTNLAQMQSELPVIVASSVIPNRGKYEKFEDIMDKIQPLLTKYGFSVTFENDFREEKIGETCVLTRRGCKRKTTYWTRVGGRSDSETQADSKAATTARRNALIRALNLVIRQDVLMDEEQDPRQLGTHITKAQAEEFQHRVKMVNGDEKKFLALAGVFVESNLIMLADYEKILTGKVETIEKALKSKEQGK
jgi:hypothetical protein